MRNLLWVALTATYPPLVYLGLAHAEPRVLALLLLVLGLARFATAGGSRQALAVADEQTARQGHPPETVRLYRYRDDAALHAARPDMAGLPVTAHAALLARVRLELLALGQAVAIEYA